ncbi:MAG: TadE/TadG family type IV pilus assembly protein, partial [Ilumatobacteraceae bacterium]
SSLATSSRAQNPLNDDSEFGQATVEFALILPLLLLCVGIVLAAGVVARLHVQAWEVAFLAGRAASLSIDDPQREAEATLSASGLVGWRVTTKVDEPLLSVRVERRFSLRLPLIGEIGVSPISAHVTMYYEALG